MRVSVDTDAAGAAELVAALCRVNIRDALRSSALRAALLYRVRHRPDLLKYGADAIFSPFKTDEWTSWAVQAERNGAVVKQANGLWALGDKNAVIDDCEGLSAIYGAAFVLDRTPCEVFMGITHPEDTGTAHAYVILGSGGKLRVFDPSVVGKMKQPRRGWYGQRNWAKVLVEPLSSGRYT